MNSQERKQITMGRHPNKPIDGAKLCDLRIAAGLSLEALSVKLKCNRSSISRWERGLVNPPPKAVVKLVAVLGSDKFVVKEGGRGDGKK